MWSKIEIFVLTFTSICIFSNAELKSDLMQIAEIIEEQFFNEYQSYLKTGVRSKALIDIIANLSVTEDLGQFTISDIEDQAKIESTCLLCRTTMTMFFDLRRNQKASRDELASIMLDFCITFNIETEEVCRGAIDLYIDTVLIAVDYQPSLTSQVVCAMILQGECGEITDPEFLFEIKIDQNVDSIRDHKGMEATKENTFKIVHLSDFHYDPQYMVGNNANCDQPTCCRVKQGEPEDPNDAAPYWGAYQCDTPWHSIVAAVQQVNVLHSDAKYVYYTGDYVDHGIWETNQSSILSTLNSIDNLLANVLHYQHIVPVFGNHESQPASVFAPEDIINPNLTVKWLYDYSAKFWRHFRLPPSTAFTIERGGYYTMSPVPGFRIIVLNNNVCYTINWWNLYNMKSLTVQLEWLHDTLLAAEQAGEKVHILYHMPPGIDSCYSVWSREYKKILQRFYKTVSALFNGHTHKDEFNLFYEKENAQYAFGVAWNGGSVTPFTDNNPSHRVYVVDSETLEVLETETWYYNLTLANETPEQRPTWEKLYDFRETYEVEDLSPRSLNDLVYRMAENKDILQVYSKYMKRLSDPSMLKGCSNNCMIKNLCKIVNTEFGDDRKCEQLKEIFNQN